MRLFLNKKLIILIFLFLIALIPRVYHLDQTTIYPDEISWTVRGKELIFTLKQGNFSYFDSIWWKSSKENEAIALPVTFLSGLSTILFGENQSRISLNLFSSITAARIPIAALNAFLIPIFYLLASRFVSGKIAFFSAILLTFDPIHLSLSRWVMLDGFLTLFIISSLYFFILALKNWKWVLLAGLSLTLAFLTKPLGILPIVAWVFLSKNNFKIFIKAVLCFLLFTWILWPDSWTKPAVAIFEYLWQQRSLGQEGYSVFFLGQVTTQPPFYYYLFQIFARLPSLILFLLVLSSIFLIKKWPFKHLQIGVAVFFISLFLIISLIPLKLGVRYALPLWPGIYLLTAWTLNQIFQLTKSRFLHTLLFLVLLISSLFTLIKYFPDYYLFYNSLIGGPQGAQKYDLVGHCISTKGALEYINNHYPNIKSIAILGCSNVTTPYYYQGKVTTDWSKEEMVIIEQTYNQLLPDSQAVKYFTNQKPLYEVKEKGATLATIYHQQ